MTNDDSTEGPRSELELRTVDPGLAQRVATRVDVERRSDLRRRLADALETALAEEHLGAPTLLPSTRELTRTLGIHRKTVNAALEMLVDRSVLSRRPSGRYVAHPAPTAGDEQDTPEALTRRAAAAALARQMPESEFSRLALQAYRRVAQGHRQIVFVEPSEHVPGISPDDLARLLDRAVAVQAPHRLVPDPNTIFVAASTDAAAVRALLNGRADVFAVGLTFDTDLRLATTQLAEGAHLGIVAADDAVLMAVVRRVAAMRPDLTLSPHLGHFRAADHEPALILAPEGAQVMPGDVPVARYRCFISPTELLMVRTRLGPAEASAVAVAPETVDGARAG